MRSCFRGPLVLVVATGLAMSAIAAAARAQTVEVKSVLLKLIERAEIPARQPGTLREIPVTEGQAVEEGDVLAKIDDAEAQIAVRRAEFEREIARSKALSDVEVRAAEEERIVAEGDLRQAKQARERLADSVSTSELEHLRLKTALAGLRVERAKHDQAVAKLTEQQRSADLELAKHLLAQRQVAAPFKGNVVEIYRQRGEWVEPGEKILRLIRLDRIRAEGFVDAQFANSGLVGRSVVLKLDLPNRSGARFAGKVLFVSPEIDPVNRQTRIWAEIDNRELLLQPGLRAQMTIEAVAPTKSE